MKFSPLFEHMTCKHPSLWRKEKQKTNRLRGRRCFIFHFIHCPEAFKKQRNYVGRTRNALKSFTTAALTSMPWVLALSGATHCWWPVPKWENGKTIMVTPDQKNNKSIHLWLASVGGCDHFGFPDKLCNKCKTHKCQCNTWKWYTGRIGHRQNLVGVIWADHPNVSKSFQRNRPNSSGHSGKWCIFLIFLTALQKNLYFFSKTKCQILPIYLKNCAQNFSCDLIYQH